MKKIFLPAALVVVLALGSCSQSGTTAGDTVGDFKSKIENCTNTDSIAAYVGQAKDYVQKLIDEGKVDEAKKYLSELEPVVQQKAPSLAGAFEAVKSVIDKVPSAGSEVVDQAKEAADAAVDSLSSVAENSKDAASDKIDQVKDAIGEKASDLKDAASDKIDQVKEAVGEKAGEVKNAMSEKASDVKDAAKDKLNNLLNK